MAEKPTGPVKPPTLDLKARRSGEEPEKTQRSAQPQAPQSKDKPAPEAAPKPAAASAPEKEKAPGSPKAPATTLPLLPLAATGIGGAALGLAAAYGLALAGFWPSASGADNFAALETRIARAENALELATGNFARLDGRLGTLETAPAAEIPQLPETLLTAEALAPLESRIEALGLRLDAVAAGLPGDESAELAGEIARLGAGLADIETRIGQPDGGIEALSENLSALSARLGTLEAQAADRDEIEALRAERDRFARLPAAAAALEAAIASGDPFGGELAAIEALLPELGLSNSVRAIAANGAKPTRQIAREFRGAIPALLAARPQDPEAGWLDTLLGQAQSAIALRPLDDGADTPEALIGRIEAALESDDAAAARARILDLPEPMQAIAAPVRADLDAIIAARALLSDIRALGPQAPEAGQ